MTALARYARPRRTAPQARFSHAPEIDRTRTITRPHVPSSGYPHGH